MLIVYPNNEVGQLIVDWLTLSTDIIAPEQISPRTRGRAIVQTALQVLGFDRTIYRSIDDIASARATAGYSAAWSVPALGLRVDCRGSGAVLASWSGIGCQWLRSVGCMDLALQRGESLASRIDIALDRPNMGRPSDHVDVLSTDRKYQLSMINSQSGQTVYLGSRQSNRFARLYCYTDKNHERSGVMRLEIVYRDASAKRACEAVRQGKILAMMHSESERLQMSCMLDGAHVDAGSGEQMMMYVKRRNPNTLQWIATSVVPSLIRLEDDGDIPDAVKLIAEMIDTARNKNKRSEDR